MLPEQAGSDHETGDHEEEINADEATRGVGQQVIRNNQGNCKCAKALDVIALSCAGMVRPHRREFRLALSGPACWHPGMSDGQENSPN